MSIRTQLAGLSGRTLLLCQDTGEAYLRALWAGGESAGEGGFVRTIARMFASERRSPEGKRQAASPPSAALAGEDDPAAQILRSHALFALPPTASNWEYEWGYRLCDDAIAMIDMDGVLFANDHWGEGPGCYPELVIGYDGLEGAALRAAADSRVKVIGLRIKSPGGDASGCFDLAETIRRVSARAGGKPVHAYVGAAALSAGYLIAAAADRITASAEALVGSIGAVVFHVDTSAAMAKAGIKITPITFGGNKLAEAGVEPITDAGRDQISTRVDELGRRFVSFIAAQRGIEESAILEMKAGFVLAKHSNPAASGLDLGLVDEIAGQIDWYAGLLAIASGEAETPAPAAPPSQPSAAAASVAAPASAPAGSAAASKPASKGETPMAKKETVAQLTARLEGEGKSPEEILAAIKALMAEEEEDDDGAAAASAGEGDEPKAGEATAAKPASSGSAASIGEQILDLPEAKGRDALAARLAITPGMTVASAKAALAASPKAGAPGFPGEVPDPGVKTDAKAGGGKPSGGDLAAEARSLAERGGLGYRLRKPAA